MSDSLVGQFFHTVATCEHNREIAEWQGQVVDAIAENVYLIQLYSWWDGRPSTQELITLADLMAKIPLFYEDSDAMRFSYEHGRLRHSCLQATKTA